MFDPLLAEMIGSYIFERRKELRITQKELKKSLGFSAQFLGRIEKGKVMIPEKYLTRLIAVLELDYERLDRIFKSAAETRVSLLYEEVRKIKKKKP
jgi:transcriptional regulator with XRE-family HTH domain